MAQPAMPWTMEGKEFFTLTETLFFPPLHSQLWVLLMADKVLPPLHLPPHNLKGSSESELGQ